MTDMMARRGPDDEGTWTDTHCRLGFRRLSILDLSPSGRQPMITSDDRYILVFNGEVYNFQDIRKKLEGHGVRYRSSGDAEVVLYALSTWGIKALNDFNGMFALAFYDSKDKKLLLARDHAGIKPLFYFLSKQGIVFASQFNQLLCHPWVENLETSTDALALYLRFGYVPAPYAMLKNTHQLGAGEWLTYDREGNVSTGRFYEFPAYSRPDLNGQEAVEALNDSLTKAVRRHLISDVPVGVFLSGGIDSPLVAAVAQNSSRSKLESFTIGVLDPNMDEASDARIFAQELGLNHHELTVDTNMAYELLDEVVAASIEPTADFSMFPTLIVSKLASEHVKVVLSGDGGDELFWGYPSRFSTTISQSAYFGLPIWLRLGAIAARRVLKVGSATREVLWSDIGRLYQKKHTLFGETDLEACFPTLPPLPPEFDLFDYRETNRQQTAQWLRWNEFQLHLSRILHKVDRASMHYSLEVRVPLLDKEVIDVATRTDWQSCLNIEESIGKLPLRHVLASHLTHQTSQKKGFTVPMHDWLRGPMRPQVQEYVLERKDFFGLPIRHDTLDRKYRKMLGGDQHQAWGLWLLLSLALWEERHLETASYQSA